MQDVNHTPANAPGFDPRLFLRDAELDYGIALILRAERQLMRETEALAEEEGLPPLGARVLMTTRFMPGQTVSALRAHLGATVPTLARILGDLDRRGLIERRRDETQESDGRTRRVYLSHTGLQLTDPAVIALRDRLRRAYRMAGADAVSGVRTVLEKLR